MADFNEYWNTLKANEGGYAWAVNDKGGETYRGIARNFHPEWTGWATIDAMKKQQGIPKLKTGLVIPSLENSVIAFYKKDYWDPLMADSIANQSNADFMVDWEVNGGFTGTKITALEKFLKMPNPPAKFTADTVTAINNYKDQSGLHDFLVAQRKAFYDAIVAKDPSQQKFYSGWIKRITGMKFSGTTVAIVAGGISLIVIIGVIVFLLFITVEVEVVE